MPNLFELVENSRVELIEKPFRHVVIDEFFKKDFYEALCAEFKNKLANLSETPDQNTLSRLFKVSYDAYRWTVDPRSQHPLSIFYSPEWDNFVSGLFGIKTSKDTTVDFHHHKVGSNDGWIHSDCSLCSFKEDRLENGVNPWYHQCIYADSTSSQPDTFRRMRAVAIIYYLNNVSWHEGDGGETALCSRYDKEIVKKIAPINNRLFAFEIGPFSFHTFLQNNNSERNTIIQWLHQEPALFFERYPDYKPKDW